MNEHKGIFCYAEVRHGKLVPTIFELLFIGRKLADELKEPLCAVLIGRSVEAFAREISAAGADKVYVLEHELYEHLIDEAYAKALLELAQKEKPSKFLFPSSVTGRSISGRLAVLCHAGALADVTDIKVENGRLKAVRPCYGGNILATVACKTPLEIVTVRPMVFARAVKTDGKQAEIVHFATDPSSWNLRTQFIQYEAETSQEIDIATAEKIVSGGRGVGGREGFNSIRELAQALGAAVGASRAAVDSGWIPYKHQVGLTGRTVRPKLYVACGISGQVQHLAGMGSAEVIVAINKDPECPMMKLATYSIEGDLFELIPLIVKEIQKHKN